MSGDTVHSRIFDVLISSTKNGKPWFKEGDARFLAYAVCAALGLTPRTPFDDFRRPAVPVTNQEDAQ